MRMSCGWDSRRPGLHRAERAHPAIRLERAVLGFHDIAGRFIHAREKSTEHHGPCAGADRLRDVAGVLDPTVRAHGNAVPVGRLRAVEDRRDLRHSSSRDDPRGADRPWAHTYLDAVGAGRDQLLGTLGRGYIPGDDVDTMARLHLFDHPHAGPVARLRFFAHALISVHPDALLLLLRDDKFAEEGFTFDDVLLG